MVTIKINTHAGIIIIAITICVVAMELHGELKKMRWSRS